MHMNFLLLRHWKAFFFVAVDGNVARAMVFGSCDKHDIRSTRKKQHRGGSEVVGKTNLGEKTGQLFKDSPQRNVKRFIGT